MPRYFLSSAFWGMWAISKLFALLIAILVLFTSIPKMWVDGTLWQIVFASILIGVFGYYLILAVLNSIIKCCDYLLKPRY